MRFLLRHALIVVIILLVSSTVAAAQDRGMGVRAGVNLATVHFGGEGGAPALDARPGLVAGAFVTLPLIGWIDIQPELLFSSKGGRLDDGGIESTLVIDYLELPVLARVARPLSGAMRIYAVAGPSVGLRLRARSRTDFGSATEEIDLDDEVERVDIGMAAGGGVEFRSLVLDARYTFSLRDIDADTSDAVTSRNRVFSITAGFRF